VLARFTAEHVCVWVDIIAISPMFVFHATMDFSANFPGSSTQQPHRPLYARDVPRTHLIHGQDRQVARLVRILQQRKGSMEQKKATCVYVMQARPM